MGSFLRNVLPCQRVYPIDRTICGMFYPITLYTAAYCHLTKRSHKKVIARLTLKNNFCIPLFNKCIFFLPRRTDQKL